MRKLSVHELQRKSVEEVKRSEKIPIIAILENIRSAYNVGSVFRTADAFLLESIFICGYTAKPPHKEISKTALGADESVNWKYFSKTSDAIGELRTRHYSVYAIEQTAEGISLHQFRHQTRGIGVVFGNEVTGIEQGTIHLCDGAIEIPQFGMKHSLNISVAAGIVLWELVRRSLQTA